MPGIGKGPFSHLIFPWFEESKTLVTFSFPVVCLLSLVASGDPIQGSELRRGVGPHGGVCRAGGEGAGLAGRGGAGLSAPGGRGLRLPQQHPHCPRAPPAVWRQGWGPQAISTEERVGREA